MKESSKNSATRKIDCPFKLQGKYSSEYNGWLISVICDEHNHLPAQHMEGHPYARRLSKDEYRLVEDLTEKNVPPRDILSILKAQNENNVATLKDIYNAQYKIRKALKVGKSTMEVLMSLLHSNGYVHDFCTNSDTNKLEALFFVHHTSFKIWRAFPYVLLIDATYKTNKYNMWSTPLEQEDIQCEDQLHIFKEEFNNQSNSGKKSFLKKLRDIINPISQLIREPVVKQNNRGRPCLKKQKKKKCVDLKIPDPGQSSYSPRRQSYSVASKSAGLTKKPARHSSYVAEIPDLNETPDLNEIPEYNHESLSPYMHPLMDEIPSIFYPYVSHIENVLGDGNCGFRAISFCLGYPEDQWLNVRHQLLQELSSSYDRYSAVYKNGINELYNRINFLQAGIAPPGHWMSMPYTGILIANTFGVILTFLTMGGCLTFFPLWKGPEEYSYHQNITFAHVHGNHYVAVQLNGDFPMPTISPYWTRCRAPCAAGWETTYMSRLESYRQQMPYDDGRINILDFE